MRYKIGLSFRDLVCLAHAMTVNIKTVKLLMQARQQGLVDCPQTRNILIKCNFIFCKLNHQDYPVLGNYTATWIPDTSKAEESLRANDFESTRKVSFFFESLNPLLS